MYEKIILLLNISIFYSYSASNNNTKNNKPNGTDKAFLSLLLSFNRKNALGINFKPKETYYENKQGLKFENPDMTNPDTYNAYIKNELPDFNEKDFQ